MKFLGYDIRTSKNKKKFCGYHSITKEPTPVCRCLEELKVWIRKRTSPRMSWNELSKATLSFNIDFCREVIGDDQDFYCCFDIDEDEQTTVVISKKPNDYKVYSRATETSDCAGARFVMDSSMAELLGFGPHARYVLEETKQPNKFNVVFDSLIEHASERIRLGLIGFSVCGIR